jgi:hypothetical protein
MLNLKEGRKGPGRKRSRQKSPCRSVVGSRLWIGTCQQPVQYNWTRFFFFPPISLFIVARIWEMPEYFVPITKFMMTTVELAKCDKNIQ